MRMTSIIFLSHMFSTNAQKNLNLKPFPKRQFLDSSKLNELADDNFKFDEDRLKVLQIGRKHCGRRRNCSLRAISPFPSVFSKDWYNKHVKTRACLGKGKGTCTFFLSSADAFRLDLYAILLFGKELNLKFTVSVAIKNFYEWYRAKSDSTRLTVWSLIYIVWY